MNFDTTQSGFHTSNGAHSLTPREAFEWTKLGAFILDVREEGMTHYKQFGVMNILYAPLSHLQENLDRLPDHPWYIIADTSGIHAREAFEVLQQYCITRVSILAGGLVEWERDGMPLTTDAEERLTGSCACQLRARSKLHRKD